MRVLLEAATEEYRSQLPGSPGESSLLSRGITKEVMEAFRLGYVEIPLNEEHKRYQDYLAIPYLTRAGPVGMRFKRIATTPGPKALAIKGLPGLPYNVGSLSRSGPLFVCEGEPDTWAATVCGLNAIGIPGAESWKPLWRRLFRDHPEVKILEQGDTKIPEGKKHTAAVDLTTAIRTSGVFCSVTPFKPGEDVNSLLLSAGVDAVRQFVGMDEYE